MIKTAIFVEGQTELVFVREYLLKMFDYQDISLECYTLFTDSNFHTTEYAVPNEVANHFFQIINVGNDNAVLSRLLKREKFLWNSGFNRIIGLRDMYSKAYKEAFSKSEIRDDINQQFITSTQTEINIRAENAGKINFHFAIMEAEAWVLGFYSSFHRMDERLSPEYINTKLGFDLSKLDPETSFYHPTKNLEDIYNLIDEKYNKNKGDINQIMSMIDKSDFIHLLESGRCQSFKNFHETIFSQ